MSITTTETIEQLTEQKVAEYFQTAEPDIRKMRYKSHDILFDDYISLVLKVEVMEEILQTLFKIHINLSK